ncbi:Chymotrypsin-2 [Pseudolycoriella hygida]|uniref:Chymotrypsin-2 n=1 Tax=Pseudolycoriella hygida TaxID=35572 RepID=A0A9Q0S2X8_9DIPT|nr:Chymotrypsin-2 [Pseudolycoriella hygida]
MARILCPSILFVLLLATATPIHCESSDESPPIEELIWDGDDIPQQNLPPYMASLRSLTNVHFCGGAIVSTRHVLTAAQCTIGRSANAINVVVGTVLRSAAGIPHTGQLLFIHPRFDRKTLINDISIIQTNRLIEMTDIVQIATINPSLTVGRVSAQFSGWGRTSESIFDPDRLHTMNTTTITNAECINEQYPENVGRITDSKICTDNRSNQRGMCYGDEGGALMAGNEIIGIASFHSYCDLNVANIYERVAHHRLWISTIIV